jgi:hypothetical protein
MTKEKLPANPLREKDIAMLGAMIVGLVLVGYVCRQHGGLAAALLAGGFGAIGFPVVIFVRRGGKRDGQPVPRPEEKQPSRESQTVFASAFRFWATQRGIQFFIRTDHPRFRAQRFVRVVHEGVPNGILYEVTSHSFDEERGSECMEIEVSDLEPMGRRWDEQLRARIVADPGMNLEVSFAPESHETDVGRPSS